MMRSPALVIGYSEQRPHDLRAYHLIGTSSDGGLLLSRHDAPYSAAAGDVSAYSEVVERMLGVVLKNVPSHLRKAASVSLINRWNRDWGVEADDLQQLGTAAANENGAGIVTEEVETFAPPLAPTLQSCVQSMATA
jgi:hypothetical protein